VQNLLEFAENQEAPVALRAEAVEAIGDWAKPSGRDRVVGLWRPLPEREARAASLPLRLAAEPLLTKAPDAVRIAAAQTLAKLGLTESAGLLLNLVKNPELNAPVRIAALKALADLKAPQLTEAIAIAKADKSEALRKESSRLLGAGDAASAIESLKETLQRGSISEQQTAYDTLGGIKGKEADAVIRSALDQLLSGKLRPELALDVLEAAAKRSSPSIKEKLAAYQATWKKGDTLAGYRELLVGGDAADGRKIFYERAEAGCFRCHKVSGDGGDVGPELAGLVAQKGRDYVLESILYPNKHIATGYETLNVVMKAGQNYAGIKKAEDEASLTLNSPEDGELKLAKKDIERSSTGMSAMPEGLAGMLNKRELRDLLEFLATAPVPAKR
jgi:quinoprotein glucose dehydrogenase